MRRLVRLLLRARRQPAHAWSDLLRAQLELLVVQLTVWTRPVVRSAIRGSEHSTANLSASPHLPPNLKAIRIARAVSRAATYGVFRPKCLVRAITLQRLLERAGIPGSSVRIGVRLENGEFTAHAWVELQGRVLGDRRDHTSRYSRLTDLRMV